MIGSVSDPDPYYGKPTVLDPDTGVKKQKFNWFPEVKCKRKDLNNTVPVHNILLFFYEITQYTHFG